MDREAIWEKVREKVVQDYVDNCTFRHDDDWATFDPEKTAECLRSVFAILLDKGEDARLHALEWIEAFIASTAERHADIVMENRGNELVAEWGKDED